MLIENMQNYQLTLDSSKRELRIKINVPKFDAARTSEFKASVEAKWDNHITSVFIDFSEVHFIDSSGVGALLGIQKRLDPQAPPIVIENANKHVEEVIKLLRLQRVFSLK